MNTKVLLNDLFPQGYTIEATPDGLLTGYAETGRGEIAVLGTTDHLALGVEAALVLAEFVLKVVKESPGCPILMLVDTQGQRLSKRDEFLGINGYLAHLVKCLELARLNGHQLLTLVYAEAVSGGFLAFGLMADEIHTMGDAQVRVMNLPAMSRITKLPLDKLEELSLSSPSFAPGVENFYKLGGVLSVWTSPLAKELHRALDSQPAGDCRRETGMTRQGRKLAGHVAQLVRES
jgi:malonate decarboxylase gamma subunit